MQLLTVLVLVLGILGLGCGKSHPIVLKWEKGASWSQRMTMQVETSAPATGAMPDIGNSMTQVWEMRNEVLENDGRGTATVESTLARARMHNKMQMAGTKEMILDTADAASIRKGEADPATKLLATMLKAMVGAKIRYQVTSDGRVHNVTGMSEISKIVAKSSPASEELLEGMLSDEMMKDQLETSMRCLPTKPVRVGEKWKFTGPMKMPMWGDTEVTSTFTLRSIQESGGQSIATIDVEQDLPAGTIDMSKQPGMAGMPGMKIDRAASKTKGTQTIDLTLGRVTAYSTTAVMETTTHFPAIAGQMQPLKSTATITTTVEAIDTPGR